MEIRLVIAIPTAGMVRMEFAQSLASLVGSLTTRMLPSRTGDTLSVSIDVATSSIIHANREHLVARAIQAGKTHLMFLDDDMAFSPDVVDILFSRKVPAVVTNYLIKDSERNKFVATGPNGRVATTAQTSGLEAVSYSGFGVSLFELDVFKKIAQPWFEPRWSPTGYVTEDAACFERIRATGVQCLLDHDASKLVRHLGASSWNWTEYQP